MFPPKTRLVVPIVEAARQLTITNPINFTAFLTLPNGWIDPMTRRTRYAPRIACNVEPIAMPPATPREARVDEAVVLSNNVPILTKRDPSQIPGQTQ